MINASATTFITFYLREGVMTAIDTVRAISGQETINTLGFCIGGTLLALALAVLAMINKHQRIL
ncbi:MAG: hypothetical protein ACNYPH_00690 [Gammaproteobacteria bacterium WSBS_2016_MAG_OTU1]